MLFYIVIVSERERGARKRARMAVSLRASSASVAINDSRRPYTVDCFGRCPRNDREPRIFWDSAIAHDSNLPATARNVYVRAERHNIDEALWNATYTSVAHIEEAC